MAGAVGSQSRRTVKAGIGQRLSGGGDRKLWDHDVEVGVRAALVPEESVDTPAAVDPDGVTSPAASNRRSRSTSDVAVISH